MEFNVFFNKIGMEFNVFLTDYKLIYRLVFNYDVSLMMC